MLFLRVLGGASLERDGRLLDAMGTQRKSLALLALLAVSRGQGISRDRLMAMLWPESDSARARGAMKQTLHVARRQLGSSDVILGTSELRLNPALISTDVDAFLGACERDDPDRVVALYGGPFLDGFHLSGSPEFEQWLETQRDEFARRHASALEELAAAAEQRGDPSAAVAWLRRLHATDPLSAQATLRLMRALDAAGERAAALRLAQDHEARFREELDSPAHPDVAALAERFRRAAPHAPLTLPAVLTEAPRPMPPEPVTPADAASEAPPPAASNVGATHATPGESPRSEQSPRRAQVAVVVLLAAAVAAFVWVGLPRGDDPARPTSGPRSVAILPFENSDGDPSGAYLADEIGHELTALLTASGGVYVAPGAVTAALHGEGIDALGIADSLGTLAVVEGSVTRDGDRLSVAAKVRARTGRTLWSGEFGDREVGDLFAIQEEIARGVIEALFPGDRARTVAGTPDGGSTDAAAYELYLRGRHSWRQRTREGLQQAVVLYEEAVERDPSFARAYAGLAAAYVNLANLGVRDPEEALARAAVAADRALLLDPALPEAHASLGFVLASHGEFRAAERSFERAIALGPDYTWAHHYYTLLLLMEGRTDEALERNAKALGLDPLSVPANATRGIILAQRGDLPGAARDLERTRTLAPTAPLVLYYLGVARAALGEHERAAELIETVARDTPEFPGVPGARIYLYRRTGRADSADSLLVQAVMNADAGTQRDRLNLALAYAVDGRLDDAFELLEGVQWDVPSLIEVQADPLLRPLRADPRYGRLIGRIR